ncbi:MAG: hypothetical protein G01um101477_146 [Candidatus Doudnabacteria bacterium Gr01-1014_77]|uniref:NIF system FeS cluster assembly NifU C-terminal domain-containing protein n=1 Tax=Candidatus Doudnabacteria bacterium Gr01-1014_77 TaxID=2017133 RepID=A0A554JDC9_9BACT|nr:MAG: hypothetical protein G01um101477_146 [Candidatus Doudnabacteria bacterium Gr01-1014_77]
MDSDLGISIMDKATLAAVSEQIAKIDPVVKAHQGGVEILKATKDEVVLALKGHCAGCPMAPITYGKVLNRYIQEACPNLKSIKYVEMK